MNKKASSILMIVFEVLAVAIIIFGAWEAANKIAKSETVSKTNLANDLVMMINTMLATEGDLVVSYPYNASSFTISLNSKEVVVLVQGESETSHARRKIVLPSTWEASGFVEQKERICFEKKEHLILLRACSEEEK